MGSAFFLSVLDELAEPEERVVPLLRDHVEVAAGVFQAPLIQLPNALAPVSRAAYQARPLHHPQVFGDCLASDLGSLGEPGDRERSVITQAGDKA